MEEQRPPEDERGYTGAVFKRAVKKAMGQVYCDAYTQSYSGTASLTAATNILTQAVTLAARSSVWLYGHIGWQSLSTGSRLYGTILRQDTTDLAKSTRFHIPGEEFDTHAGRQVLLDPGDYTFYLRASIPASSTGVIFQNTDRTYLEVIVIPTRS